MRTHIAPGSPNKQDTHGAHGSPLGEEEIRLTKEVYGYPSLEPFFVPDEALEHFRGAVERGREQRADWEEAFDAYRRQFGDEAAELERWLSRARCPPGLDGDVPKKGPDAGMIATRKASQEVIQWAAAQVPEMVGGSADLAPSTLTLIDGGGSVEAGEYGGRNLHFGIREHAMGAIVNGLTLYGFRAYGAGFLIFSDYMKGSIRLAAIMRIPSTFVFTHDSIGVGEDGPTHQPIEQLVTLRATPNLDVVRPAGFNETALAWRHALRQTDRPTALALSRQGLPVWDPAAVPDDAIERGAYVLHDSEGGDPELVLMATGSEVHIANDAAQAARSGRHPGTARVDALPRPLRRAGPGLPRQRPAAGGPRPRRRRGGQPDRLAPVGRRPRRRRRDGGLRRLRAREGPLRALRVHRRGRRRARPGGSRKDSERMSVTPQVNERLAALTAAGTSVWLDQIRRGMIESGELARMVEEDSLRGVTSNPAIFEKAILGSPDYDADIAAAAREGLSAREVYRRLAVRDVQLAADVLRPVYDDTNGYDGYVSLEVAPRLAHDTEGTIEQARMYWGLVDRPNLMIKIPATPRGDPRDRDGALRGHERQRHAAVRRRGLRGRHARVHPRDGAPPRRGPAARPPLGRVVLRLARRHRGRQAARRRSGARTSRAAPGSPTRAPPTRRSSACSAATSSPRCATPAARSSARCGRRPA